MPLVFMIAGLVLSLVGAYVLVRPLPAEVTAQGTISDLTALLKEVNALLDKFDKRYRPGVVLMVLGLALIGVGVFLQASDAEDAAETAAALLALG